ncbi:MAG: HPr family phosphocarrier protein [Rhizobiaceae bacterium]|jgi:phosphocarrier protein|nr:HPr family phosphocarrier protein [Rhizobiaceae bacterium]
MSIAEPRHQRPLSPANGQTASSSVRIAHGDGLHARPSVRFTQVAKRFSAEIEVALDPSSGPWADAKSIMKVMGLKAPQGALLHVRACGPDARHALDALVALVAHGLDAAAPYDDVTPSPSGQPHA